MKHARFGLTSILLFGVIILFISGCAKVQEKSDMSLEELKEKATALLKKEDYEEASEYLQCIITRFPDNPKLANYKISLANCKFKEGSYEPAYQLYENFYQYYPSDKRAEFAKYRAALCKFNQILSFDRDQSPTEAAIRACKSYEEMPTFNKYRTEIEKIHKTCVHTLINKELHICKFYIKQGKTKAAQKRLEQAQQLYGNDPEVESALLYLQCKLANKEKNNQGLQSALSDLSTKYPDSKYVSMAENLVKKPIDFVF